MCEPSKSLSSSSSRLLNFFVNETFLYFGDGRNNIAFFKGKIPHQTSIKRVLLSDFEVLKPTKFTRATIKPLCHPSCPTDFFTTQILGGHGTSRYQGLSSNDQGRKRKESLGTRLRKNEIKWPAHMYMLTCSPRLASHVTRM